MKDDEILDYDSLAETFSQALIHTLRKHSVADTILDYWVPDSDPVLGVVGMVDSARIAGQATIAIRFRRSTIPDERLPELERAVGRFAKTTLERLGDQIVLRATAMSHATGEATAQVGHADKPTYWRADLAGSTGSEDVGRPGHWDAEHFPEFADAHPQFRAALEAVSRDLTHEGEVPSPGGDLIRLEQREGAAILQLDVDPRTHLVRRARHCGAIKPSERAALDLFCRATENLPLQEVADHVGLVVVGSLAEETRTRPVPGILLPVNAGAPFTLAPRLARRAYEAYRASLDLDSGANFYYAPPAEEWQALSRAGQQDRVARGLKAFLQSENLSPEDMELLRIEKNKYGYYIRGVIGFSDRIGADQKPSLIRRLEKRLRRSIEAKIELVADRARDSSPLRRLS